MTGFLALLSSILFFFIALLIYKNSKHKLINRKLETEIKEKDKELNSLEEKLRKEMSQEIEKSAIEAKLIISNAKKEAKDHFDNEKRKIQNERSIIVEDRKKSEEIAENIIKKANQEAKDIAGEAFEAQGKAKFYEDSIRSMKNIIKGYGDEYLISGTTLLDDLANEYDHEQAGQDLKNLKKEIKKFIKEGKAVTCDYVEDYRKKTAIAFTLDAFNGKVDSIMSKVKVDNFGILKTKIEDAFSLVNYNGSAFRNARVEKDYLSLAIKQLKLATTVLELKRKDQEEQKRIKDQIREEERAKREYDKAIKEAEKEEKLALKALKDAEKKLKEASEDEKNKLEAELAELKEKLRFVEEKGQRAISMAQQTKRGHVYIISNVGSFGDNVFKIGLTRRLEPMDRVKELGDASVPFSFDVHAMIYSEDAPNFENELHKFFRNNQVNKINSRKEFFNVSLQDIKKQVDELGINCHWTMKAEALEYRESIKLKSNEKPSEVKKAA